jgi:hypothetical protein
MEPPYGLGIFQSLDLEVSGGMAGIAEKLKTLVCGQPWSQ